jgi:ATP-dependent exoDNAse (exonuclease V) alpha subunit
MTMQMAGGVRKALNTDRVLPVEYGYATTGHSAQGLGADRVLLDKDVKAKTTDHRSFYTDLTRARYAAVVYTDDRAALPQAVVRRSQKTAAMDVVETQRRHIPTPRAAAHPPGAPPASARQAAQQAPGPQVGSASNGSRS